MSLTLARIERRGDLLAFFVAQQQNPGSFKVGEFRCYTDFAMASCRLAHSQSGSFLSPQTMPFSCRDVQYR